MLRLVWSENAQADLEGILDYITYDNPSAARRLKAQIDQSILTALEYPEGFRPGGPRVRAKL